MYKDSTMFNIDQLKLYKMCRQLNIEHKVLGSLSRTQFLSIKEEVDKRPYPDNNVSEVFIITQLENKNEDNRNLLVLHFTYFQDVYKSNTIVDVDEVYEVGCDLDPDVDISTYPLQPVISSIAHLLTPWLELVNRYQATDHKKLENQNSFEKVAALLNAVFNNSPRSFVLMRLGLNESGNKVTETRALWGDLGYTKMCENV